MPYSVPAQARPGHRRSFSHIVPPPSLASTTTTGAFASLGALPTRRRTTRPTFHLGRDDDDDDSQDESPQDTHPMKLTINTNVHNDDERAHLPPLRLKTKFVSSFDDQQTSPPPAPPAPVPFPRSSPLPSPTVTEKRQTPEPRPLRPSVSRTTSSPILLPNGKPLKSSLKSSSSSPNIPFPPQSLVPSIMFPQLHEHPTHHQRAASAPALPHLDPHSPNSVITPDSPLPSPLGSPPPQKNVHFPSQEEGGLTTVRVFNRSAKPASLLRIGDETETETEGESSSAANGFAFASVWGSRWNPTSGARASAYPFPRFGSPLPRPHSPLVNSNTEVKEEVRFEIDIKNSSPIPARGADRAEGNIYFESLGFVCEAGTEKPAQPLTLTGTVLVRNIAFHKIVAVRYTLDDWHTTNDVQAHHEKSLAALPERFLLASLPMIEDEGGAVSEGGEKKREVVCRPFGFEDVVLPNSGVPTWDRFRFEISLERYEGSVEQRTMWFVGRYCTSPVSSESQSSSDGLEWWDNNSSNNYRIGFVKKVVKDRRQEEERKRREGIYGGVNSNAAYRRNVVISAPPVFTPSRPFPAPPQISASLSYPISMTQIQREQAAAHSEAVKQSTLARLKRLNLMNYAAPSPSTSGLADNHEAADKDKAMTDPVMETSTANTSADSTPLQTPTQDYKLLEFDDKATGVHDVNVNVLVHDGEDDFPMTSGGRTEEGERRRLRWDLTGVVRMQDGYPATVFPMGSPSSMEDGSGKHSTEESIPTATSTTATTEGPDKPIEVGKGRGRVTVDEGPAHTPTPVVEMGTSPPFSVLEGGKRVFASQAQPGLHWLSGTEDHSTSPTPTTKIVAPTPTKPMSNIAHTRTSSDRASSPVTQIRTSSNDSNSAACPLIPPQRRKTHQQSHLQPQVPIFSIGRTTSSSSSRSGSGSGSGSDTGSGGRSSRAMAANGSAHSTVRPKLTSPQPWPLPPHSNQMRRVMSPPPVGSPRRIFEMKANDDDEDGSLRFPTQPPQSQVVRTSPITTTTATPNVSPNSSQSPLSPVSSAGDSIYQAVLRQWCFAQGPGPNVGGSVSMKSDRATPLPGDVVVQ